MQLDHATIVTDDIEGTRHFFSEIAGLDAGPRPPFRIGGYWLYLNGKPVIHVVEATLEAAAGRCAPRIDHIALRIDNADEWSAFVDRLTRHDTPYQLAEVPLTNELQLFVSIAPGVTIEFVTSIANIPC